MNNIPQFKILGTRVDLIERRELDAALDSILKSKKSHYIVTPNPEIVLLAQKDKEFQDIINKADISIADGIGLIWAGRLNGVKIQRHTGSGLVPEVLEKAQEAGLKVMIINLLGGLSTAIELKEKVGGIYPKLKLEVIDVKKDSKLTSEAQKAILSFGPDVVFVTLGMIAQEKLIAYNLTSWPSVKLAMAVGGSFELLTGKIKKPPVWMHKLGLEWIWRVMMNPKRFTRPLVAIPTFLIKIFFARIKRK